MSEGTDREERAILDVLAALETEEPEAAMGGAAPGPWVAREESEADDTLRRLHLETLGLLAYAAEPEAPSAGARERLLAALGAPATAARRTSGPEASETGAGAPRRRRGRGGLLALAAVLLMALVGVAWLYLELEGTRTRLARLEQERIRLAERLSRQEELIRRGGQTDEVIAAIATPGVDVCPLHPMGDPPFAPGAFAVLYMPPGSGNWYLLGSNLRPAEGVYMVWLETDRGAVPAGVLDSGEQSVLELDPAVLGDLSGLTSITVTMEPSPDMPEPQGPMVLYGDEKMTVL